MSNGGSLHDSTTFETRLYGRSFTIASPRISRQCTSFAFSVSCDTPVGRDRRGNLSRPRLAIRPNNFASLKKAARAAIFASWWAPISGVSGRWERAIASGAWRR